MNLRNRIVGVESVKVVMGDAGVVADNVEIDSAVSVGGRLQKQGDPHVGLAELAVMEALPECLVGHAAEIYRFAVKLKAAGRSGELVHAVRIFQRFVGSSIDVGGGWLPTVVPALASRFEIQAFAGRIIEALVSQFTVSRSRDRAVGPSDFPDLVPGKSIVAGFVAD